MNKHENKKYCSSDEIWCTQRKELIKSVLETKKASDLEKQSTDIAQQYLCKRKLTAVCSHQTRIGNLDAHLTQTDI